MNKESPISETPGRGRPRQFDLDEALKTALTVFWQKGYEATSVDDLIKAMGLSKSSFYASFGSKRDILLAALKSYHNKAFAALKDASDRGNSRQENVQNILAVITQSNIEKPGDTDRGCFSTNCVAELAPHDEEVALATKNQLSRVIALIAQRYEDELAPQAALLRANMLMSLATGAVMLRKAGVDGACCDQVMAEIEPLLPGN